MINDRRPKNPSAICDERCRHKQSQEKRRVQTLSSAAAATVLANRPVNGLIGPDRRRAACDPRNCILPINAP